MCGTDKVTYPNECEMNMTACVLGDVIRVVHKGKCPEETGKCMGTNMTEHAKFKIYLNLLTTNKNVSCLCFASSGPHNDF